MHLKCMCRGCDMSAGGCAHPGGAFSGPCATAKAMLKEVDQHIAKGETEQQIIQAFVAEYGTIVYVEPPKNGFGLVAWIMPFSIRCWRSAWSSSSFASGANGRPSAARRQRLRPARATISHRSHWSALARKPARETED